MESHGMVCNSSTRAQARASSKEEVEELRRGPWTAEEDLALINYIENHGEGRWNSLARCSGLKRTGKSCRLRWLNYLRPDVRRGNITPEEQLLILELHSQYGNRWSKIAQHLPGRTDNEIKNYWRTRVQKHAKQLQCDVNSKKFKDIVRYVWMPRLLERIRSRSSSSPIVPVDVNVEPACTDIQLGKSSHSTESTDSGGNCLPSIVDENINDNGTREAHARWSGLVESSEGYDEQGLYDFEQWGMGGNLWNAEDIWF